MAAELLKKDKQNPANGHRELIEERVKAYASHGETSLIKLNVIPDPVPWARVAPLLYALTPAAVPGHREE
jgi:hypothetical protein